MIEQLRCQFPLAALLKAAKMSRSTFYYQRSHEKDRQNKDVMFQIKRYLISIMEIMAIVE